MDAFARSLDVALNERQQWVVPVYQRHYSWKCYCGEENCASAF